MFIVTGGAGFIGSNIVKGLNAQGHTDILVVDDLTEGKKFTNIADCEIADYQDLNDFLQNIICDKFDPKTIKAIFHEGACSSTTEWDGRYMMENNYEYSKQLLHYCVEHQIPFIYASSAAVYGAGTEFAEHQGHEKPLNVYGYSKWLFDQYVLRQMPTFKSQVVGLRYFNVYGPHENHKGSMASVAFHLMNQLQDKDVVKLFEGCDGYGNGEQRRDFVFVDDVVKVNCWLFEHPDVSGVFNVGSGESRPFNDVANILIKAHGKGKLEYIPFPEHLKGAYQSFTEANINNLRKAGYLTAFATLEIGLSAYYDWLCRNFNPLHQGVS